MSCSVVGVVFGLDLLRLRQPAATVAVTSPPFSAAARLVRC